MASRRSTSSCQKASGSDAPGNRHPIPIIAIGSGGGFAQSAAKALLENTAYDAKKIVDKSLNIAAHLCIYTNESITVLEA